MKKLREIQMGELTMKFLRFLVIGAGRLFGRTEGTEMDSFPIMANSRIPFPITLMPTHSLETTRIIATNACIPLILGMASLAKILLSIVESVMVFVIYFLRRITIKNYLMHKYVASASGIKSVRSLIPTSIPILLIQSFKVFSINNCILPLCQSNKTVGLVKRLDNRMAFHSAFHWSSMKGLMNFSRYVILFALILLAQSTVFAQNPVSGGPIPQATYTTPPVLANPTHGTGAPSGTCMSGILYTNDSNGNLYSCNAGTWGLAGGAGTVTHTGNLTLNSMLLGNGVADTKIDTACVTDGAGALSGCLSYTTNGTTAGFFDYAQGTSSAAVAPCNVATSICEQAPTAVTSYLLNKLAGPSSGLKLESNSASVLTETSSGDANHSVHVTAQTATKTIYTICPATAGGCNVAGQYRVTWYFNQGGTACGTPTPGQVTFALSWTDNAGAHSAIALPMNDNSSIAVFTAAFKFAATNVTGFASGEFNLWSTGAQPIQVTNTYTACGVGTGTWELTAAVEQVQ